MRLAASILALAVPLSACVPRTQTGRTTIITGGVVVAAIGAGLLIGLRNDDDPLFGGVEDGPTDGEVGCVLGGCVLAGTIIAAGTAMVIGGLVMSTDEDAPPPMAAPIAADVPAPVAIAPAALLPAIETDRETLRYARAVELANQQQQCGLAHVLLDEIGRRDARYHAALVVSPVAASCR